MECEKCKGTEKTAQRSDEEKKNLIKRLNIVEGQVRGIKQMIEDDRYCGDVLIQMSAINKALESVENSILENHMRTCMSREIKAENMETIKEVMELIKRLR